MKLVRLLNNTSVAQNIVFQGRQIIMGPNEEGEFHEEVANKFLEMRAPLVSVVEEDINEAFDGDNREYIWVANMTGNPDAPDSVHAKIFLNNQWTHATIPNPNKEPRILRRKSDGGMVEYVAKDGALEAMNAGKITTEIPPFKRRKFSRVYATWWLNRDGLGEAQVRGASIKSRAPSNFEPDLNWSLDEMRSFLKLMDPNADLGRSKDQVTKEAKKRNHRKAEEIEAHIRQEKTLCMKRLYFRLADPRYPVPTREEFSEFLLGAPATPDTPTNEDIIDDAEKQLKKARTRRRKKAEPEVQPEV